MGAAIFHDGTEPDRDVPYIVLSDADPLPLDKDTTAC